MADFQYRTAVFCGMRVPVRSFGRSDFIAVSDLRAALKELGGSVKVEKTTLFLTPVDVHRIEQDPPDDCFSPFTSREIARFLENPASFKNRKTEAAV